jgi:hypothetical protein
MNNFKRINNVTGWAVFAIAAVTYLLTIEPTTSFWDCGEFIASSYKLEVGHPPGNPVFQLLGRFFSMFAGIEQAALMINAMNALCSAFTILFLFWTVTHLARRIVEREKNTLTQGNIIAIMAAGAVGALAYTFSDTFWFSAVEAEVYAMSSLFTALVFWAILRWEEEAGKKYANRWIILIAYLMGLSVGVHLLNLLAIPAIVLIYYFKKYTVTPWGVIKSLVLSVCLLGFFLLFIPMVPRLGGYFDLLFVNLFGLPFNTGFVVFVLGFFALLGWLIYLTHRKGKALLNTITLCLTVFMIGFSSFAMVVIRSSANTPTNENQPDNAFALLYYLNRDQYGSVPLISGQTFATPAVDIETNYKYTKQGGRYVRVEGPPSYKYDSRYTMLFPRMHSTQADHVNHYKQYMKGRGKLVPNSDERMPTFRENLTYFFDYQLGWMYWRYFMWNFAGRQNDIQGHGESYHGNWECGIPFIDQARLGNVDEMPPYLAHHKSRNHYYLLPLLLGLVGLLFQLKKDKRNFSVVLALFVLTGIAIVVYLNQSPFQPRERDYAYAGSFYAFTIWIGLGAIALYELLRKRLPDAAAVAIAILCLGIPLQMAAENWDDHNRAHRYTARDMAYNYFMTCDKDAIIITVGDNDTFPLWYIQEVQGLRTDVRVVNTSLLGTDWYIDQLKCRQYEAPPVPFSLARENYLPGTNDYMLIEERVTEPRYIKDVMNFIADPKARATTTRGKKVAFLPVRNLIVPVDKETVLGNGTVRPEDADRIPAAITLTIPKKTSQNRDKDAIIKAEMMILDLLASNNWERPIYFVSLGGDVDLGLRDYLRYEGFAYRLTPIRNNSQDPQSMLDKDALYHRLKDVYRWGNMSDPRVWMDYNNFTTLTAILNIRNMHCRVADAFNTAGDKEKAAEVLDMVMDKMPDEIFPYSMATYHNDLTMLSIVEQYYIAEQAEKAEKIIERFLEESDKNLFFYTQVKNGGDDELRVSSLCLQHLASLCRRYGNETLTKRVEDALAFYTQPAPIMQ